MKFLMHYVDKADGQERTLGGRDRWDIETQFRRLAPEVATARVYDERGTLVAAKELNEPWLHGVPAAIGWGPVCPDCWTLAGCDRHTAPHAALSKLTTRRYRGGMADGTIVNYGCANCGVELQLDNDRKDPGAGWSIHCWPTWVPDTWGAPLP